MKIEREIGSGKEYVYLFYNENEKLASIANQKNVWPCKIGKSKNYPTKRIPLTFTHSPMLGLVIKTDDSSSLERYIHSQLKPNRMKKEWFNTNPTLVENLVLNMNNSLNVINTVELGYIISKKRISKKLTQQDLAKLCGIRQATISKIEKGMEDYNIDTLFSILEKLDLALTFYNI